MTGYTNNYRAHHQQWQGTPKIIGHKTNNCTVSSCPYFGQFCPLNPLKMDLKSDLAVKIIKHAFRQPRHITLSNFKKNPPRCALRNFLTLNFYQEFYWLIHYNFVCLIWLSRVNVQNHRRIEWTEQKQRQLALFWPP